MIVRYILRDTSHFRIVLIIFGAVMMANAIFAADAPSTNTPTVLPTVTIVGTNQPQSITSPSEADAEKLKTEDPGAFTLRSSRVLDRGRGANFEDFLGGIPGVILQSENEVEVSKISIRGSGILSEDEPLGVNFLLDGFTFNQGDGEVILEDFDVGTLKYGEVYRGASAFKYGSLTLGGAVNLVSKTGYDADAFGFRIEGGSYGFVRGQASTGAVEGPVDFYASLSGRSSDGYRDHSYEDTQIFVSNLGYKISDTVENRFYLTADRTDRLLPGGLTKEEMYADPRQTDTDSPGPGATPYAISQGYNKDWYYLRLADKVSIKTDTIEGDAGVFWWHRNITEKGPDNDESSEGIQDFFADNIGFILNFSSTGELFGQRNIFTAGFTPNVEREVDSNFRNTNGLQGAPTAHDQELSINAPLFAENQHYFTEKFSVVMGIQASYAQRHFSDFYFAPDQSANVVFRGISPKLGAIYELDETNQLFANLSRGWQPPSFDNMVDFDDAPDVEFTRLAAQRSWTAEVGARGGWGPATWDLALYHSWVRDELLKSMTRRVWTSARSTSIAPIIRVSRRG
jgi:iron complex outermembrane receptor protein